MKHKIVSAVLVATMSMSLLIGCGKNEEDNMSSGSKESEKVTETRG